MKDTYRVRRPHLVAPAYFVTTRLVEVFMSPQETSLQRDYEVFERSRKEWSATHANEFVLIGNGAFGGFYPDYESALRAGLKNFGVASEFLVKQVCKEEPVFVIY